MSVGVNYLREHIEEQVRVGVEIAVDAGREVEVDRPGM
jgi:hypothetical protein